MYANRDPAIAGTFRRDDGEVEGPPDEAEMERTAATRYGAEVLGPTPNQ
jgi:hypothetical protein